MAGFTVLGAGIVGACVALALRRDGHDVTLVDRDEPGNGCSFGNAGFIQNAMPHPMAMPGLARNLPRLLFDAHSPLSIKWRHLPRLAPWLARFLRSASPARVERIERDQLRQMEPALNPDYADAYHLPETFYTVDPSGLTRRIVERLVESGGTLVRADIRDIELGTDGPRALTTATGAMDVDNLVVAAGIQSAPFAARLGDRVPLESARGYHVMIPDPGVALQGPVVDGAMHFGATPMRGGLRLAGTLEFASVHAPPDFRRADMLLPMAKKMLPGLSGEVATRWMGHRPATPDSLPVLGRSSRSANVVYAFGHGQLGLTMAAVTGEVIADVAAGRDPGLDLAPYSAGRFRFAAR